MAGDRTYNQRTLGRIGSHPRIKNISIHLLLPGDENGDPPGRYRPARCGNPNPTGWLLIGWGSWSQRAARVAPGDTVEVPPHPGRIGSHLQITNPSISLTTPPTRRRKRRSPGSIPLHTVWKRLSHWLIADWLGVMEPARGESCPSGQRRGSATPGEDKFPSPGQKLFHIFTTPTTRGRKRRSG